MKNILLPFCIVLLITVSTFSQAVHKDYIVYKDNDTIFCTIKKYGNLKLELETNSKKVLEKISTSRSNLSKKQGVQKYTNPKLKTIYLSNIVDVYLNDSSKLFDNPLDINIEEPEDGFAHVYLYRPYYYNGSALGCKIKHNDKNFINIKTKSYFLHKIEADQNHVYERTKKAYLTSKKRNKVRFFADNKGVYFIKAINNTYPQIDVDDEKISEGAGTSIYLDETKHNKYLILNMKKISSKI